MTIHRARCYCRRPNTLVNQSKRVSARIACMGSISLTAKNAKARGCASICVIKTDAQFANAQVWPSAPAQPTPLFSRETGVGFILFHAKCLLFSQNRIRRQRHTCVASVCVFLSWAVASCDIVAGGGWYCMLINNASEVNHVVTLFIRSRRSTLRFASPGHNKVCEYVYICSMKQQQRW